MPLYRFPQGTGSGGGGSTPTSWKEPARVATVGGNIVLAGGAPDNLDGVPLAPGDRILVKNQTLPQENGIYGVQTLGTGADGVWVRTSDANTGPLLVGAALVVLEGAQNADKAFLNTANPPITLGVTPILWAQFPLPAEVDSGDIIRISEVNTLLG